MWQTQFNFSQKKKKIKKIGPFFFENEPGKVVTGNSDRYRAMLNEFLFTKIEGGEYWQYFALPGRSYTRCLTP